MSEVMPDNTDTPDILYEERGDAGLAYVRLNRPAKHNALTAAMLERLAEIFRSFDSRTDLRAVVLTGAGAAAFCAG
ncbi:MAG: hypothetical protein QOG00_3177, partial [Pyrinomonadaceae bacterium]|nr:hypothetical protein [Pyrinomonadaceae bacterium]